MKQFINHTRLKRWINTVVLVLLAIAASAGFTHAEDWPQWRGPRHDNLSRETEWFKAAWAKSPPKTLWAVDLPDTDVSPVVAQGRVYTVVLEEGGGQAVWCFEADTGKILWKQRISGRGRGTDKSIPPERAIPHATPAVVDGRVFAYGCFGELACLDAKTGQILWSKAAKELASVRKPNILPPGYGYGCSPLVFDGLVVVSVELNLNEVALVALKQESGKEAWRNVQKVVGLGGCWSSPVLADIEGKRCLVHSTGQSVLGLDPSTGQTWWRYLLESSDPKSEGHSAATPVVYNNKVFASCHLKDNGSGAYSVCLEIVRGQPKLLWKTKSLVNFVHSPVVLDGCLLSRHDGRGIPKDPLTGDRIDRFQCWDMDKGELLWHTETLGAQFTLAGNKLLVLNGRGTSEGVLSVVEVSRKGFKELGSVPTEKIGVWNLPVLANGRIYITGSKLSCLDCTSPSGAVP